MICSGCGKHGEWVRYFVGYASTVMCPSCFSPITADHLKAQGKVKDLEKELELLRAENERLSRALDKAIDLGTCGSLSQMDTLKAYKLVTEEPEESSRAGE